MPHRRARCQSVDEARSARDGQGVDLGDVFPLDPPEERFLFEARSVARGTGDVAPIAGQKNPDVELIALGLQPPEKSPHSVEFLVAVEDEPLLCLASLHGGVEGDAPPPAEIEEVRKLLTCDAGPGLDSPLADRFVLVRDHEIEVDVDDAPEAAAGLAGPDG